MTTCSDARCHDAPTCAWPDNDVLCRCGHHQSLHYGEEGPCLRGVDLTVPSGEDGPYCKCEAFRRGEP